MRHKAFHINYANITTADALAPCAAMPSVAKIQTIEYILVSHAVRPCLLSHYEPFT